MNTGKTVFSQILDHLPRYEFDKFVKNTKAIAEYASFHAMISFSALPMPSLRTGKA